jgi:hypothetical protein
MASVGRPEAAFQQIQHGFADHIRSLGVEPAPADVPPERMAVYRELFFNNVEGFLADSFPVLRRVVTDAHWQAMARDFYARHSCRTPLFTRLGEEFLAYLRDERGERAGDPPFLAELAHYEWVELALTLSEAEPLPPLPGGIELPQQRVGLSPLAWSLRYRFAVHRIGVDSPQARSQSEPVHLLACRDHKERVVFLEIDPLTHSLLTVLQSVGEAEVSELLETLAEMTGVVDRDAFLARGLSAIEMLSAWGVIGSAQAEERRMAAI